MLRRLAILALPIVAALLVEAGMLIAHPGVAFALLGVNR